MKYLARGAAIALAALMSIGVAQANTIEGVLNFTGEVVPIFGPGLEDAVGLSFTSGFTVSNSTGAFDENGVDFGDSGTLFDFFFAPELDPNPVNPLLTILFDPGPGKFTFVLEAIEVVGQGQTFLLLSGTGTLNGSDLDATPFDFSMSVDGSTQDLFTFSGTLSSATVVPVPGALILFMSGLTMLGFRRRS